MWKWQRDVLVKKPDHLDDEDSVQVHQEYKDGRRVSASTAQWK